MAYRKIQGVLAQMQKNLECSICLEMMRNPVSTACGHQFCRFCIMEFLERKKQVPCPLCKKPLTKRGLMEREQLGEMVLNVHKLIEAYQTDTGTLFSPPRGASVTIQPSTPECIKAKASKAGTGRPSNTRQSGHTKSNKRRISKETRRLQMDIRPKGTAAHSEDTGLENLPELNIHDGLNDINRGDDSNKGSEEEKSVQNSNVQELLNMIEIGSHGAFENQAVRENDKKTRARGSEHSQKLNDNKVSHKITRDHHMDTAVRTNTESTEGEKQKELNSKVINEDIRQSGISISSQGSSEDIISLFRTPVNVKQLKQKQTEVHNECVINARSLRSAKTRVDRDDKDITNDNIGVPTQDFDDKTDFYDSRPENIKTYSKKKVMGKDSKSKVSDWLKNLPDNKCETREILHEKASYSVERSLKSSKRTMKKVSKGQKEVEVTGKRMAAFVGMVNKNCKDSMFGFGELDVKENIQEETVGQNYQTDMTIDEAAATNEVSILNQRNQDLTLCEKEKKENQTGKPVQRKRIFKSKIITNRDTKCNKDIEPRGDAICSMHTEDKNSNLITTENASKPEVQKDLTSSTKSKTDNSENKLDQLESNIIDREKGNSFINECEENVNGCIDDVTINERTSKNNCVSQQLKVEKDKPERLLKMVYSPMDTSQSCGDPYEFRSSQKTPKKQLKGKRCTSNKYKVRNNKGRVVKVTDKPGPKKKTVSRMSEYTDTEKAATQKRSVINLETGMGDKLKSTDVINCEKINKDIDGIEIQMIAAEIDKAEEHDLLTSTQEALTKMTDNGVPVTVLLKENSSQKRCNKKIVRFREPVLSDFISPSKIDVRKCCGKKAVENKEKEQSTLMSFDNETGCSGIHEYNNKIEKKLCDRKTTNVTSIKEIRKGSHAAKEEGTIKELPRKEDEDSDDLSEDYRFHDNSSGTDDLDINPDQHEFEQPDLEKQPENVKALLSQNEECNYPKVASTSCAPDLSSLTDTPQVLNAPHFKSTSAKILKETMITQVGVVKETPLIVSSVADTPQALLGPYTTGNLHRKMKEARVQSASMSKEIELDANLQVDTEYCNENPVKVNGLDSKEKPSLVGCGNDKEVGTSKETLSSYTLETDSDTDLQANINTFCENPVKLTENCCKEKPEIHGYVEAVRNYKKLNLQNFDTDTLEEKEYGSIASIFTADKDQKVTGKASDYLSSETFIATKVTSADIEVTMDTDETQTPGNFDIDEMEDEEAVICEGETYTMESKQSQSDDQDVTRTTVDSQTSVSVLEPKYSSTEKAADNLNETDKEPKEAEVDSDIVEASTDSDKLKIVKKKRKCFMLEDTQDEVEADLDKCLPGDITPKRQKTDLQLDTKEQLSVNENGVSMHAEQLEEGLSKTNAKTMERFYNEKKGITGAAGTAADLDVISQSSSKIENSFERERHLSGILISPNDTFHKSPENIFSSDAGMPAVDFSPEEETQCEEDNLSLLDNPGISDTEKTHVSDTQISVTQQSTPESCKRDRQNSKVRAARGFSKRVKNSSGNSVPTVKTTEVLKLESNKLRTSPGSGKGVSPVRTITNHNRQKDNYRVVSPASHCSLTTPSKANVLKYRSPVASIKPLGQGTNSPMVSPSASSFRNVSKYSPGLHRTPKSNRSTCDRNMLVGNTVEVVEVARKDVKEVEILGDDTDMRTKDTCRKVHTKGEMRNNDSYNNDKSFDKEINCSSTNVTAPVFIDLKKDLNNYKDCPMSKESIATKRSPKLQLHLGSQERQKMVEEIPTDQDKECLTPPNITDQQRESCKELNESNLLPDESKCTNEESKYSNSDNTGEAGNMIDSENSYDQICKVETDRNRKNEFESESNPLDNDVNKEGEELASSPYLVIEDGVIKNFTCPENSTKTAEKVCDKQSGLSFLSSGKADNMYTGLDLSSDESDSIDVDIHGKLCERTKKFSKVTVGMNGKEAEVIEESDLDEDLDEDQGELEGEQDEIRTVKRLRPKRAILSDSDNTSEDESLHLDCTSSSAFSSQSENLTTQEREKLEKDLEKMAAEMALLKEQLEKNQDSNDAKNGVVILDDDEEQMIHMDDSDKEMVEESCLSPPPFSPDMLSQEKSRDCVLQQDSATEDIGSDNKKADSNYTENAQVSDSKENVPIRKPLTDLDVNVIRKKTNQDLEPDMPAFSKKRSGFVATGLSSFQVMEVKKMASVSDIQFYSKMTPSVSHVIVKSDENDDRMCDRTLKFFQGIARKCWLVNYQWILDSKEAGYLLPETAYEIQGDTTTGYIHEGPKRSRLSKGNLFNGIKFSLFGENQYLNKDSITELIKDCGGETVDQKQLEKLGENRYVICCLDLDEEGNKQKKKVIARSEELRSRCGVVTLKRDWIMDSITTYKLQPIKLYTISSELD